jgi:hypothetical protein
MLCRALLVVSVHNDLIKARISIGEKSQIESDGALESGKNMILG